VSIGDNTYLGCSVILVGRMIVPEFGAELLDPRELDMADDGTSFHVIGVAIKNPQFCPEGYEFLLRTCRGTCRTRQYTNASGQNSAPCRVDTFGTSLYLPAFFMRGIPRPGCRIGTEVPCPWEESSGYFYASRVALNSLTQAVKVVLIRLNAASISSI